VLEKKTTLPRRCKTSRLLLIRPLNRGPSTAPPLIARNRVWPSVSPAQNSLSQAEGPASYQPRATPWDSVNPITQAEGLGHACFTPLGWQRNNTSHNATSGRENARPTLRPVQSLASRQLPLAETISNCPTPSLPVGIFRPLTGSRNRISRCAGN